MEEIDEDFYELEEIKTKVSALLFQSLASHPIRVHFFLRVWRGVSLLFFVAGYDGRPGDSWFYHTSTGKVEDATILLRPTGQVSRKFFSSLPE